eukprot:6186300-Amphidinium_carterae.1
MAIINESIDIEARHRDLYSAADVSPTHAKQEVLRLYGRLPRTAAYTTKLTGKPMESINPASQLGTAF